MVQSIYRSLSNGKPDLEIQTDATRSGWGAVFNDTNTGGHWSSGERQQHINFLEMKPVFWALKTFCSNLKQNHIKPYTDNTTAVAYINSMGGSRSESCCKIARQIWLWCIKREIWLTAVHLPGSLNTEADRASRVFNDRTEWTLNPSIFKNLANQFSVQPTIDLFASRLNYQIKPYISWKPDPEAFVVDAFTLDWSTHVFYAFPPFSLLGRVLQNIQQDQAEGILILPCGSSS